MYNYYSEEFPTAIAEFSNFNGDENPNTFITFEPLFCASIARFECSHNLDKYDTSNCEIDDGLT